MLYIVSKELYRIFRHHVLWFKLVIRISGPIKESHHIMFLVKVMFLKARLENQQILKIIVCDASFFLCVCGNYCGAAIVVTDPYLEQSDAREKKKSLFTETH